jgi:cobalamin-dependent methionine synthase I
MSMGKKTEIAATPEKPKEMKPSATFDVSPDITMPKLGQTVTVEITGRVIDAHPFIDRWDKGKKRASIQVEYDGVSSVKVHPKGKRTEDELERENARV